MPQIDKVTFAPMIFSACCLYLGSYIAFNVFIFLRMFNLFKLDGRHGFYAYSTGNILKLFISRLFFFPWLSI